VLTPQARPRPPSRRRLAVRAFAAAALVALTALGAGCSAEDEIATAANDVESDLLQDQLDDVVEAGVPGVVLFVKDPGTEPIVLAEGLADIEAKTPMAVDDGFRIGSVTKPYVATVVLQLVDEGLIALDDPVETVLPGLLPNGDEITVKDLLGHRSGLFEYLDDPRVIKPYLAGDYGYEWTPEDLVEVAVGHGSQAEPGTEVGYSNTNYTVLGMLIEAVTDNTLGDELEARIFEPLGLDETSFATSTKIAGPHAHGYLAGEGPLQDVTGVSPSHYWGAGNIVSPATDVARFYDALLGGELLSQESLEAMKTVVEEEPDLERGLGLAHGSESCGDWYGHDGAVPGYLSAVRMMDSGRQVVLLVNSVGLDDSAGSPKAQASVVELLDSALCR
jgi:D-alanyl-D-alanine carboxypeptidase